MLNGLIKFIESHWGSILLLDFSVSFLFGFGMYFYAMYLFSLRG